MLMARENSTVSSIAIGSAPVRFDVRPKPMGDAVLSSSKRKQAASFWMRQSEKFLTDARDCLNGSCVGLKPMGRKCFVIIQAVACVCENFFALPHSKGSGLFSFWTRENCVITGFKKQQQHDPYPNPNPNSNNKTLEALITWPEFSLFQCYVSTSPLTPLHVNSIS